MNEVIVQEYEAKINEKTTELANIQAEGISQGMQAALPEALDFETAELMQELISERNVREKLQSENTELETDLNRYKVEYEGQIASLTVENEELIARITALENETVEQEEKLQDTMSELQVKQSEVQRLKEVLDPEHIEKAKGIEGELINPDTPKELTGEDKPLSEDYDKL
jgi:chromosome segregation ATPase